MFSEHSSPPVTSVAALRPTIGLFMGTGSPVLRATSWLSWVKSSVCTPGFFCSRRFFSRSPGSPGAFLAPGVSPIRAWRTLIAMTTSSKAALPPRGPIPLIVHSTWRSPASHAATQLAVAMPSVLWQCTLMITCPFITSGSSARNRRTKRLNDVGVAHPAVSARLRLSPPGQSQRGILPAPGKNCGCESRP